MTTTERKENLPSACYFCGQPVSLGNSFSANLAALADHFFDQGKITPPLHQRIIANYLEQPEQNDCHIFPTRTCPGSGIKPIADELGIDPRQAGQLLLQIGPKAAISEPRPKCYGGQG